MMDLLAGIDWDYWTAEKSAALRNFILIGTALVGLIFLIWRAWSADRSARAALKQATASADQLKFLAQQQELLSKQTESLAKQPETARKQADISTRTFEANFAYQYIKMNTDANTLLSESASPFARCAALMTLRDIATARPELSNSIAAIVGLFLRHTFPANLISLSSFNVPELTGDDRENVKSLCALSDAVCLSLFRHPAFHDPAEVKGQLARFIEDIHQDDEANERIKTVSEILRGIWYAIPSYVRAHELYKHAMTIDRPCAFEALCAIREKCTWIACDCSPANFSGINLATSNISSFWLDASAFRGAYLYNCDLSETNCINTIFLTRI